MINSVDRALAILCQYNQRTKELGITELSQRLDLPKSTVHGMVETLEARGFLFRNSENGKYRLGLKVYELGMAYSTTMELQTAARPVAQDLSSRHGKSVHVAVYAGGMAVFILKIEHRENLMVIPRAGLSFPAHSTAAGKALLAHLPEEEIEKYLSEDLYPLTRRTITDKKALAGELEKIRVLGYATDSEETMNGIGCVAAPIRDQGGQVVAAVSLSGLVEEVMGENLPRAVRDVKEAGVSISRILGFMG